VVRATYDTMYHMKHPQVRRARKIGEAVFRGAAATYTFEVFPLTHDIRDSGAIFIISRRITDRGRSGHHRTICIGEAHSIVSEIKKHKRAKCARAYEANAVCILREDDRAERSHVIDDLVSARSFDCIRNVAKPILKIVSKKTRTTVTSANNSLAEDSKAAAKPISSRSSRKSEKAKDEKIKIADKAKTKKASTIRKRPAAKKALEIESNARTPKQKKAISNVVRMKGRTKKKAPTSSGSARKKAA
jgi:hypothetical protein